MCALKPGACRSESKYFPTTFFYFTCFLWGLESIMGGLGVSGRPWAVLGSLGAFLVLKLGLASGPWRVLGECERPARSCGMKEGPGEVLGMGKPTAWDMG